MTIGPVQLLVLGFNQPHFDGAIRAELTRLHDNDLVRVVDAVAVYRKAGGEVEMLKESQLSTDERIEFGALVGGLVGLGAAGEAGLVEGAELGAQIAAERGAIDPDEAWDVVAEIPEESAAALILIEHRWAIPLRDLIAAAGGFRLASEFISPLDLVAVGMLSNQEAEALLAVDGATL